MRKDDFMAKKKPYVPNHWSYMKPKEDDRRKLTLFVAGAVPPQLPQRLDRLTANYDVVTVLCAGNTGRYGLLEGTEETEMEKTIKEWAHNRRQEADVILWDSLNTVPGWMQFMGPDGNKAVIVYNDGVYDGADVSYAKYLAKQEGVQFRETKIEKAAGNDFTKAVENLSADDQGMAR